MKRYVLDSEMVLRDILDFLSEEGDLEICIDSNGWVWAYFRFLSDVINKRGWVRLVWCGTLYSMAFWLFYNHKWERALCKWSQWMVHKNWWDNARITVDGKIAERDISGFWFVSDFYREDYVNFLKEDELKEYDRGHNVWLWRERLISIFKWIDVI